MKSHPDLRRRAKAAALALLLGVAAPSALGDRPAAAHLYEYSPGAILLRNGQPVALRPFMRLETDDELSLQGAARVAFLVPASRRVEKAVAPARLRLRAEGAEAISGSVEGKALPEAAPSAAELRLAGDFRHVWAPGARRLVPPLSPQARTAVERLLSRMPAWRQQWPGEDALPELFTLAVIDRIGQPGDAIGVLDSLAKHGARDAPLADLSRRLGAQTRARNSVGLLLLPFAGDRGTEFVREVQQFIVQSGSGSSRSLRTISATQEIEGLRVPATRSTAMVRAGQVSDADIVLFGVVLAPRVSDLSVTQPGSKCIKVRRTELEGRLSEECIENAAMEIICTRRTAEWQAQLTVADVAAGRTTFSDTVVGAVSGDGCGFQAPPPAEELLQEARLEVMRNVREILSQSLAGIQKRFLTPESELRSASARQEFGSALHAVLQGDEERACRAFRSLAEVEASAPAIVYNAATCEESEGRLEPALRLYRLAASTAEAEESIDRVTALLGADAQPPPVQVPVIADATEERRIALVIGNAAYGRAPLRNAVNDARDISRALAEAGFEVIRLENGSLESLGRGLEQYAARLAATRGVGLLFYAGHGIQVEGENFLIPVDADLRTEKDVPYRALNVGQILAKIEQARNRLNLIFLDACRDNPFARTARGGKRGLASIDAPKGTLIAYSTAPGRTADDGEGRNGLYTKHLLREIRVRGQRIEDVLKRVRTAVANESRDQQVPWESSSLTGDFFFVRP